MLEHIVEVVALHDHIVEFQEAQALLHALLIALGPQHIVDGEAGAHLPQQVHVVQLQQPVGVVEHDGLALAEVDEALHLTLEAGGVVVDVLLGEHLAHIRAAGGVADHGGAAADQGDGLVARHLQALHQSQGHEMACRQGVRRAVKADIERGLAVVDHLADLFLVCDLGDQAPSHQFFINSHVVLIPFRYFGRTGGKKTPPVRLTEGDKNRGTTSASPTPRGVRPHRVQQHPIAVTGEPDTFLIGPKPFRRLLRDVFSRRRLSPFHRTGTLFAGRLAGYFFPSSLLHMKLGTL